MKKNGQALFQLACTALEKAGAHSKMAEAAARADGAAHPALVAERAGTCLIDNRDGLPYVSVESA